MTELPKRRYINFRFFPLFFLSVCIGSLVASLVFDKRFYDYYVLGIGVAIGIVIVLAKGKKAMISLVCIFALLMTYVVAVGNIEKEIRAPKEATGERVTVRVEHVLQDAVYVGVVDGIDGLTGLCEFDVTDFYDYPLCVGNQLVLGGVKVVKLQPLNADGSVNTFYFNSKTKYVLTATELLDYSEGNPDLIEIIRNSLHSACHKLPEDIKGVTYALLTGDKYAIDDSVYDGYKVSGVAHVLAVSGMHVGFLVLFLEWLLKKLKLKRKHRIIVNIPVMLFLSALCDFTPSVVRACIMCTVHLLIPVVTKRRYDIVSSMSLSGSIIVILNPMAVFSYGFLLSFASVGGIVLFSRKFTNMCLFVPKRIRDTVAISLSATLGVLPLSVYLFGEFSLLSLLTNVLILPILSVAYGFLVACAGIAVIFPPFSFLLVAGGSVGYYLNLVTGIIASVDIASVAMSAPLWFIVFYYVFVILLSDFVNFSRTVKRLILLSFCILVCAYFCFFCNFSPQIY